MDVGNRIRELRKARGLTQAEVAARTGIAQNHLSRLEVGRSLPTLRMLQLLGVAFGIHPSQFLLGAGQTSPISGWWKKKVKLRRREQRMLEVFRKLNKKEQKLLLSLAIWLKNSGRIQ